MTTTVLGHGITIAYFPTKEEFAHFSTWGKPESHDMVIISEIKAEDIAETAKKVEKICSNININIIMDWTLTNSLPGLCPTKTYFGYNTNKIKISNEKNSTFQKKITISSNYRTITLVLVSFEDRKPLIKIAKDLKQSCSKVVVLRGKSAAMAEMESSPLTIKPIGNALLIATEGYNALHANANNSTTHSSSFSFPVWIIEKPCASLSNTNNEPELISNNTEMPKTSQQSKAPKTISQNIIWHQNEFNPNLKQMESKVLKTSPEPKEETLSGTTEVNSSQTALPKDKRYEFHYILDNWPKT